MGTIHEVGFVRGSLLDTPGRAPQRLDFRSWEIINPFSSLLLSYFIALVFNFCYKRKWRRNWEYFISHSQVGSHNQPQFHFKIQRINCSCPVSFSPIKTALKWFGWCEKFFLPITTRNQIIKSNVYPPFFYSSLKSQLKYLTS